MIIRSTSTTSNSGSGGTGGGGVGGFFWDVGSSSRGNVLLLTHVVFTPMAP